MNKTIQWLVLAAIALIGSVLMPAASFGADVQSAATAAVDAAIAGKSQATTGRMFSSEDYATLTFTRNPDFWLTQAGVSTVGISVSNSHWNAGNLGYRYCATPITPHHLMFSWHVAIGNPSTHTFVLADNSTVTVHGTTTAQVGTTDIAIQYVTEDMEAAGIPVIKILPADWYTYLSSFASGSRMPVVAFIGGGQTATDGAAIAPHDKKIATVRDLAGCSGPTTLAAPTNAKRLEFYYDAYENGDSGNPVFVLLDGELVLLSRLTSGGAGAGTSPANSIAAINTAIDGLGGTNTHVTIKDLSAYTQNLDGYLLARGTDLTAAASYNRINLTTFAVGPVPSTPPGAGDTVLVRGTGLLPPTASYLAPVPANMTGTLAANVVVSNTTIASGTYAGSMDIRDSGQLTGVTVSGTTLAGATIPTAGTFNGPVISTATATFKNTVTTAGGSLVAPALTTSTGVFVRK